MSRPEADPPRLSTGQALALGTLHGPAELLPISSSAHIAIVAWLLSWRYLELDPELRKSFEVALHAGTAAAQSLALATDILKECNQRHGHRATVFTLAVIPPAIVGYVLEGPIERRLGGPVAIAAGLLAGSAAMGAADRTPQRRGCEDAGPSDALWLGLAQACALVPGISRSGATVAAARWRGFRQADANWLSGHIGLPVIGGAAWLKGRRLSQRGLAPELRIPFAVGAAAAFASTLGCAWIIRRRERDRSLRTYAIYRATLAMVMLARVAARHLLRPDSTAPRSPTDPD